MGGWKVGKNFKGGITATYVFFHEIGRKAPLQSMNV